MNPVRLFEESIEEWFQVKHAVAVCNGSAAIKAALLAVGVKPEQYVVTTPFTFVATGNAIIQIGAKPLFVDIKAEDYTIDPKHIWTICQVYKHKIGAILPVHIFGNSCDMTELAALRDEFQIPIVEDACQAIGRVSSVNSQDGSVLYEKYLGTFFDAGCLSFYGSKNLWTYEGGMVLTKDTSIDYYVRKLRNHGLNPKGEMDVMGYNWKMGWINAFQGWQQVKMHKKAIVSELGLLGPKDGYYKELVYDHPWYQENPKKWFAMDCPVAEREAEKVRSGYY